MKGESLTIVPKRPKQLRASRLREAIARRNGQLTAARPTSWRDISGALFLCAGCIALSTALTLSLLDISTELPGEFFSATAIMFFALGLRTASPEALKKD